MATVIFIASHNSTQLFVICYKKKEPVSVTEKKLSKIVIFPLKKSLQQLESSTHKFCKEKNKEIAWPLSFVTFSCKQEI